MHSYDPADDEAPAYEPDYDCNEYIPDDDEITQTVTHEPCGHVCMWGGYADSEPVKPTDPCWKCRSMGAGDDLPPYDDPFAE